MKKIALLSVLFLMTMAVLPSQAQETKSERKVERKALHKLKGNEVSQMAKNNFNSDFGEVQNAIWKREGTYDQVSFTQDGHKKTAYYDEQSNLVGTAQKKALTDLPAKAQKEISTKYKDYKVEQVIFYDDNEADATDMILYEVQFEHADNYFVELTKADKTIILEVPMTGEVILFKTM